MDVMDKKMLDTYSSLTGETCQLHTDVRVLCEDSVVKKEIGAIPRCADATVREIVFLPFDRRAKGKISAAFGKVFENKPDAYAVVVEPRKITVYTDTANGARYGACALRSHVRDARIPVGILYNVPLCSFRAYKTYLPAADKLDEFYAMMDFCMAIGLNTLVVELGGAMEYRRHPEINEGWIDFCKMASEYNGKTNHLQSCVPWAKDSMHIENGGGSVLSQDTLRAIADYAAAHGLQIIPEVPSLSHSEYLLTRHPELAENPDDPVPDTYCPSDERSYTLLFDVLDEVLDVFHPKTVHIAHDEWYTFCHCERCKGHHPAELYVRDIRRIRDYLAERGVKTMMWGDRLVNAHSEDLGENHGGAYVKIRFTETDKKVNVYGKEYTVLRENWSYHADEVQGGTLFEMPPTYHCIGEIPKDITIMNWYHSVYQGVDDDYARAGLPMVYGNFTSGFKDWFRRVRAGALGACVSNWGAPDLRNMQRGGILFNLAHMAMMFWNRAFDEKDKMGNLVRVADFLAEYQRMHVPAAAHTIRVRHTCELAIRHGYLGCGVWLHDPDFLLGYYRVVMRDGTEQRIPISFGDNIGTNVFTLQNSGILCETMYTTEWQLTENKISYRFTAPLKGEPLYAAAQILPQYRDHVSVCEIILE